jgi:hypothetical protein
VITQKELLVVTQQRHGHGARLTSFKTVATTATFEDTQIHTDTRHQHETQHASNKTKQNKPKEKKRKAATQKTYPSLTHRNTNSIARLTSLAVHSTRCSLPPPPPPPPPPPLALVAAAIFVADVSAAQRVSANVRDSSGPCGVHASSHAQNEGVAATPAIHSVSSGGRCVAIIASMSEAAC